MAQEDESRDRVKKGMLMTLIIGFVYTILTNVLLLTFSEPLMRLFSQDAAGSLLTA